MKGFSYSAFLLASALAFSTGVVAQDHESSLPENANSGVDSAQDVNPTPSSRTSEKVKDDDLMPNSGVDSSQNVDPSANQGSTQQLDEEELAPESGRDSANELGADQNEPSN